MLVTAYAEEVSNASQEMKAIASIVRFSAENCLDEEFGRLRKDVVSLMYITLDKADEVQRAAERIWKEANIAAHYSTSKDDA